MATPTDVGFFKRETFGYSLNGKQFLVAQGDSYRCVEDAFSGSAARVLGGDNTGTEVDRSLRPLVRTVNTGWSVPDTAAAASHVLHLWGMSKSLAVWDGALTGLIPAEARTDETDVYVLSMSYFQESARPLHLGSGGFGIATRDAQGGWVNAVDLNHGGAKRAVVGPWRDGYALGTYGVDPSTKTAWAVVNHEGEFVVASGIEGPPGLR